MTTPAKRSQIRSGETLQGGESLYSPNGRYRFSCFKNGKLILVEDEKRAVWWTNTTIYMYEHRLVMQDDGNLVLYDNEWNNARWTSKTDHQGNKNSVFTMQDDGAAVISCDGKVLRAFQNVPSDRLIGPKHLETWEYLQSPNGKYQLRAAGHQVGVYDGKTAIWEQQASGNVTELEVMDDDDFVVVNCDFDRSVTWSTSLGRPKPCKKAILIMQDNGVAVLKTPQGKTLWSTNPELEPPSGPDVDEYEPVADNSVDCLNPGQSLLPGTSLKSANGLFKAVFKQNGAITVVHNPTNAELSTTPTASNPMKLCMTLGSNLWVFDTARAVTWKSPEGRGSCPLILDNDGHLFINQRNDNRGWSNPRERTSAWSSGLWIPAIRGKIDCLLPGQGLLVGQSIVAGDYTFGFTDAADLWVRNKEGKTTYYYTFSPQGGAQLLRFDFDGFVITDGTGKMLVTAKYPEPSNCRSWKESSVANPPKLRVNESGELVATYDGRTIWSVHEQGLAMGTEPTRPKDLGGRLGAGRSLRSTVPIRSPDGQYSLILQADGNLAINRADGSQQWAAKCQHSRPARFAMQVDGNLVVYGGTSDNVKWTSASSRKDDDATTELVVLNSGEAVVRNTAKDTIWSTSA